MIRGKWPYRENDLKPSCEKKNISINNTIGQSKWESTIIQDKINPVAT